MTFQGILVRLQQTFDLLSPKKNNFISSSDLACVKQYYLYFDGVFCRCSHTFIERTPITLLQKVVNGESDYVIRKGVLPLLITRKQFGLVQENEYVKKRRPFLAHLDFLKVS